MASPIRERQTELTRESIRSAARRLFAERGFAGTSVRQLATEAGVAVRTVYLAFGSKQGVLLDLVLAIGVEAGMLDAARSLGPEVIDPRRIIAAMAHLYRNLYERGGDVITMLRGGAASEPELKTAQELGLGNSRAAIQGMCLRLEDLGALRPGLDVDEAAGHALVLVSDDGHDELVHRRGWSHDRYEVWLESSLEEALLGQRKRAPRRTPKTHSR
jgi:AcrR family transcriptional regulator